MLRDLVDHFSHVTKLPVEVEEIVDRIKATSSQDEIYLFEDDTDPTKIWGAFHQFTYQRTAYGEPILVTHVSYSANVALEWQRVIAVKELVHIFDSKPAKTDTDDEVNQLLDKLMGPLSNEDYGFADLQAAKDRLALYQSLPLLLPHAALAEARQAVRNEEKSHKDVANWACMPVDLVGLMLRDEWDDLNSALDAI